MTLSDCCIKPLISMIFCTCAALAESQAADASSQAASLHIIVALVDNASQGIVPVPARIGDGNVPKDNLYWGAAYGVKHFLSNARGWKTKGCSTNVSSSILERCTFEYAGQLEVIADAYRGDRIGEAMLTLMQEAATPPRAGRREMLMFVGHNGLMDSQNTNLEQAFPAHPQHAKQTAVLACLSDRYFRQALERAGSQPVVTTFSFMAPEAYVVEAIARNFASDASATTMRRAAGAAYARYQKISLKAGSGVFGVKP